MSLRLHRPSRLPRRPARAAVLSTALLSSAAALAYVATTGAGSAQATVATIVAPLSPTAQQSGANVAVSWNAATLSTGGAVEGYRVTRSDGVSVCGSPTLTQSLSCTDSSVPAGTYMYTVAAIYHSWDAAASTASVSVLAAPVITASPTNPSVAANASFSFTGAGAYQCQLDGGTFQSCSSPRSYSGLADGQHTFKVHATNGSTNGADVSYAWTIDSAAPQITTKPANPSAGGSASFSFSHTESAYTFKCQIDGGGFSACSSPKSYSGLGDGSHSFQVQAVGADGATSTATSATWLLDGTAPSGGSVSFASGYARIASVSVSFTAGSDGGTGLNPSAAKLLRASATLSGGSCGSFSSYSQIGPSAPSPPYLDSTVTSGNCYRYQYLVSDAAGNQATYTIASVAEIDTQAPAHALSASGSANAYASGSEVYYKGDTAGTVQLSDALGDSASGPATASFPAIAAGGWTHNAETVSTPAGGPYVSSSFSWAANSSTPASYTVTGADAAGNTASAPLSFASDTTPPTGGVLKVNGKTPSPSGRRTSTAASTNFTIDTRTDYAERQSATQSGLRASTLSVQSENAERYHLWCPGLRRAG